jgi:hypothetical protein
MVRLFSLFHNIVLSFSLTELVSIFIKKKLLLTRIDMYVARCTCMFYCYWFFLFTGEMVA